VTQWWDCLLRLLATHVPVPQRELSTSALELSLTVLGGSYHEEYQQTRQNGSEAGDKSRGPRMHLPTFFPNSSPLVERAEEEEEG
jgi:hypothetical protein